MIRFIQLLVSVLPVLLLAAEKLEYTRYVNYPAVSSVAKMRAQVKRGEYLVKAGDCAACHTDTKPGSKTFAGGLGIKTPFGTFYTPNITPDKETGIGNWTDEAFVKVLQTGVGPHFKYLYPVFPYPYYARVRRDDLLAIRAYLSRVPAVHAPKKKNDVPFPFNVRFLQIGWRLLFFHFQNQGEYRNDPTHTAAWNRGAYLVQGLGHCGMCHTPINVLGAPKRQHFLQGALVDGYYAPNITSEGLKQITLPRIVRAFKLGESIYGKSRLTGPMEEVNHNSLRYLKQSDLHAMAVYLKSVQSKQIRSAKHNPHKKGKIIYADKCAVCHNTGAAGAPKRGDYEDWEPRLQKGLKQLYHNAIHGINAMPARGACMSCTNREITLTVDYLVREAQKAKHRSARKGKPPQPTSFKRGEAIYTQHCAVCHDNGTLKLGDKKAWAPKLATGMPVLFSRTLRHHTPVKQVTHDGDWIAAIKYMAQESSKDGDYHLW